MAKLIRPAFDAWVEIFSTTISLHKMQKKREFDSLKCSLSKLSY